MTYCVAAMVDEGLVFVSDSRTNAGADRLGTYSKMHRFFGDGERCFVLLSAGNLATTQGVVTALWRDIKSGVQPNLATVADLEEGAECVGLASIEEQQKHRRAKADFAPEASFIFGGQIRGEPLGLFHVYPEGNFVRASQAAPFLQIGEVKYGKAIVERIVTASLGLQAALTCLLVSMDSTLHSNATVGPPIEALVYPVDAFSQGSHRVLDADHPFMRKLRDAWNDNIRRAFDALPDLERAVTAPVVSITRSEP